MRGNQGGHEAIVAILCTCYVISLPVNIPFILNRSIPANGTVDDWHTSNGSCRRQPTITSELGFVFEMWQGCCREVVVSKSHLTCKYLVSASISLHSSKSSSTFTLFPLLQLKFRIDQKEHHANQDAFRMGYEFSSRPTLAFCSTVDLTLCNR
jgi:hypothetical protein